jgi:hypothetical protein
MLATVFLLPLVKDACPKTLTQAPSWVYLGSGTGAWVQLVQHLPSK